MSVKISSSICLNLNMVVWELEISTLTLSIFRSNEAQTINFLTWQETIHPQDKDLIAHLVLDTINDKRANFDCQFRIRQSNNQWAKYRMRGAPDYLAGAKRFTHLRGILEDFSIQEQRIIELQRQLSNLERKAREKNDFFASITHELRTPLTGVLGLAELLSESDGLNDEQREMTKSICQCGKTLLILINDTLDLAKLEARKLTLTFSTFSLDNLLADLEKLFIGKFEEKKLTFVTVVGDGVPDLIISDPNRLQQVLLNLIGNAQKFTPAGGGICLQVDLIETSEQSAQLLFSVVDSGIGIKSENQRKIFDEYSQETDATAMQYGGTGLGLSIAGELVSLFGGELKVKSEPGKGTVFQFSMKVAVEPKQNAVVARPVSETPTINHRPLRILLAEDNQVNQKVASRMLEKSGHTVVIADNGKEAVTRYQQESFDLILMDIQMPVMSGEQAVLEIRGKERAKSSENIPIIALTAHAMSGDREKYLQMGMNGYVSKPISRDALLKEIWSVIRI